MVTLLTCVKGSLRSKLFAEETLTALPTTPRPPRAAAQLLRFQPAPEETLQSACAEGTYAQRDEPAGQILGWRWQAAAAALTVGNGNPRSVTEHRPLLRARDMAQRRWTDLELPPGSGGNPAEGSSGGGGLRRPNSAPDPRPQ